MIDLENKSNSKFYSDDETFFIEINLNSDEDILEKSKEIVDEFKTIKDKLYNEAKGNKEQIAKLNKEMVNIRAELKHFFDALSSKDIKGMKNNTKK